MKKIRELLHGRAPIAIEGSASALDAARRMGEAQVGSLLILAPDGSPRGVFTERDLMVRVVVAGLDPATTSVESTMSTDLFTASPEERINDVEYEMQRRHIRHLPVVENGSVVGMLSLRDLLREHIEVKRDEVRALKSYIQGEGEGPVANER